MWSSRDKKLAVGRVSPGAKVMVFLIVLVTIGILGFVGYKFVTNTVTGATSKLPEQVVAGETFEAGANVDLYGSKTEAVLDGVTQKVRATNPTDEWKKSLEKVDCNKKNVCTALAPDSATDKSDGKGPGKGGFLGTGMTIGTIVAVVLGLAMFYYAFLAEDSK